MSVRNYLNIPSGSGEVVDLDELQNLADDLTETLSVYPLDTFLVTNSLTYCTTTNSSATITEYSSYSATINADLGYMMNNAVVEVLMDNVDITNDVYTQLSQMTGSIYIPIVTGNIVINIIAAVYVGSVVVNETIAATTIKSFQNSMGYSTNAGHPLYSTNDYQIDFEGSGTAPYISSTPIRIYRGSTLKFQLGYNGIGLRKVIIYCSASNYMGNNLTIYGNGLMQTNTSDYTITLTPNAGETSIGVVNGSGGSTQIRFNSIYIEYEKQA